EIATGTVRRLGSAGTHDPLHRRRAGDCGDRLNTTIQLVRHATHDAVGQILVGRMPGVRLSADGRQQAARLAAWFAGQAVDAVQSSPRERARETARPIAERSGRDCEVVVTLEEV